LPYVYEERAPKAWASTCVAIYLVGVTWMGVTSLPEDLGPWLAVSGMFLLLLLPCLIVPISKHVYHRIQLTPETLRVGRERLAVSRLDPPSIHAAYQRSRAVTRGRIAAALAIDDVAQVRRTPGTAESPRLVGGGWRAPMGTAVAVIVTRDGEYLGIAARNRDGFLRALLAVTGQAPVTPANHSAPASPHP